MWLALPNFPLVFVPELGDIANLLFWDEDQDEELSS